jgi:hypothetical protein
MEDTWNDGYDAAISVLMDWRDEARESMGSPPLPMEHPKVSPFNDMLRALYKAKPIVRRELDYQTPPQESP